MLDDLPPIVVVDTPEGLLLVDGYHRLAAARLGDNRS
jgi:ParB-like chromosome segregation protein Spo0J